MDTAASPVKPETVISPEADLLICCARTTLDRATKDRILALVQQDIDWTYLNDLAEHHQVMPLLYRNLNATCAGAVPEPALNHLRRFFYANAMTGALLSEELVQILNLFTANNIVVAPYKGPALAASVYGDVVFRTVGDLDVLVRRRDVEKARELLLSRRYRSTLTDEQEKMRLDVHYHLDFMSADGHAFVELHWALTPKYWAIDLDLDSLEDPLESVSLAGKTVPNLPQRELFLILCAHGAKHYWTQLRWLCDIAELLRHEQNLNWEKLIARANRLRCRRILYLGVFLAKDVLGAEVPEQVWRDVVKDPVILQLAAEVREKMFPDRNATPTIFDHRSFFLRTREQMQDRLRYFYHDHLRGYFHSSPSRVAPKTQEQAKPPAAPQTGANNSVARPVRSGLGNGLRLVGLLLEYASGSNVTRKVD
jgi:hypothetical protein